MWQLQSEADYYKRLKRLVKKHRREIKAVHDNLDTFFRALCEGSRPHQVKLGCIHAEPHGVLAIDQKGGGTGLKETRLYIYPDEDTRTLYVVTLGDKSSQSADIRYCNEWVTSLRYQKEVARKEQQNQG